MSYTVRDVCAKLEELAVPEYAYDWDNIGLLVGRADKSVSSLLVTLTVTEAVVDAAIEKDVDLIVAHHPVIFKPLSSLRTDEPLGALLAKLTRHDLAVYVCHTNLDRAPGGLNAWLARDVGIHDAEVLVSGTEDGVGLGRVGTIAGTTLGELARKLSEMWNTQVRVIGDFDRPVRRIAVIGGSGGDYVAQAKAAAADVLVTGDVSYHDALDAEAYGLGVLDAGHFATEQIMVREIAQLLRLKLPLATVIEEPSVDPFQFKS